MRKKYINVFTNEYKKFLLEENPEIDKGIKDLVDAINNNKYLVTMNSCQGAMFPKEAEQHCPITYVDFYALNHKYDVAHNLLIEITHVFGSAINCSLSYEPDFDIEIAEDGEEYSEDNGFVDFRYRIEINDFTIVSILDKYKKLVEVVNNFNEGKPNIRLYEDPYYANIVEEFNKNMALEQN